jgi:hypothetical protein
MVLLGLGRVSAELGCLGGLLCSAWEEVAAFQEPWVLLLMAQEQAPAARLVLEVLVPVVLAVVLPLQGTEEALWAVAVAVAVVPLAEQG